MESQPLSYIRVGTNYYKTVNVPLISGDTMITLKLWSLDFIKQDHGRDILAQIPKYDGFCVIPDHINYKAVVGNFYNKYLPFSHKPEPGYCSTILQFLEHIFQEQFQLGLDYVKLLVEQPVQKLPILCLVSKERNTGKTTFLMFLKILFGGNMTINTNEDFRSNFNSEWAGKLIIGIDETFLDKKEDSERIKNLATASVYKAESKGLDRQEIEFFGKFILCSNNEDNFIVIDPGETRYWVIRVTPIAREQRQFLRQLEDEIPHFLDYIGNRSMFSSKESRLWFNASLLQTEALLKVIRRSRNRLESEILNLLTTIIENREIPEVCFCVNDLQDWLLKKGNRGVESFLIRKILQEEWDLKPSPNSLSYTRYAFLTDGTIAEDSSKGRFYTINQEMISKLERI